MVLKFDHFFSYVNQNRKIHLYIPNNYYESDEKYPVIYFLDGNNVFFDGDSLFGMSLQLEWYLENFRNSKLFRSLEPNIDSRFFIINSGEIRLARNVLTLVEGRYLGYIEESIKAHLWI